MTAVIPRDLRNIVDFIESQYLLVREIPTPKAIAAHTFVTEKEVIEWMNEPLLAEMLERRGISLNSTNGMTPEMLACANVMLDFSDRRSKREKLRDLGLTTARYNAFLRNPQFNAYVTARAEQLLPDTMHEAHVALVKNVERGDTQSLKLYYEITGRHNPAAAKDFNPEALLTRIFEVITIHVKDPEVLQRIAADLAGTGVIDARPPVAGEIVSAETMSL